MLARQATDRVLDREYEIAAAKTWPLPRSWEEPVLQTVVGGTPDGVQRPSE